MEPRISWWHLIGATPALVVALSAISVTGLESPLFWAAQVFAGVLYLAVLLLDIRQVRLLDTEWQPETWRYALLGLGVLYTAGFFSFVLSPYYLYKRRKYVGSAVDSSTVVPRNDPTVVGEGYGRDE